MTKGRRQPDESIRSVAERNALVEGNLALVRWVVNRMTRQQHVDFDVFEELCQAGMLGLIRAAERFDPARGAFSTFAQAHIRQQVQYEIRATTFVHIPAHVAPGDRYRLLGILRPRSLPEKGCLCSAVVLPDPNAGEGGDLDAAMRRLPARWRFILAARYWEGWTLKEVAGQLGVKPERVRQIQCRAVARLRKLLGVSDTTPARQAV